MSNPLDRRDFLNAAAGLAAAALPATTFGRAKASEATFGFGLVTYMWGAEWDLPTLLKNCRETKVLGVELRTTHKHKVEPNLDAKGREEVRNRFADSGVTLVGLGSNERFDDPDPAALKKAIEASKEFIRLSHDIGGSGVKVKPDSFHKEVPREKTIEQIGKALNELGEYAAGFGQQVRLEVHGQCAELPTIKAIMDIAKDENVAVCWNSNPTDLKGDGLEANFNLVAKRFGQTVHVHELDDKDYPYAELFKLLVKANYEGWLLLEAASKRDDYVAALAEQKQFFDRLLKGAQG
jgi:sugar phosphate isomerase/epimerase